MAEYEVSPLPDGRFAVVEVKPSQLAIFEEEFHAEVFMRWLRGQPIHGVSVPVTEAVRAELDKPSPEPSAPQPVATENQSEPDWDGAFKRIAGGEKVKDVAEDIGVPMPTLRGRWVAFKRTNSSEIEELKNALEPIPEPDAEVTDSPVSGGLGGVLQRGQKPWTQVEIDALNLAEASGTSLASVAKQLGRSEAECQRKLEKIDAGIQRVLS